MTTPATTSLKVFQKPDLPVVDPPFARCHINNHTCSAEDNNHFDALPRYSSSDSPYCAHTNAPGIRVRVNERNALVGIAVTVLWRQFNS